MLIRNLNSNNDDDNINVIIIIIMIIMQKTLFIASKSKNDKLIKT